MKRDLTWSDLENCYLEIPYLERKGKRHFFENFDLTVTSEPSNRLLYQPCDLVGLYTVVGARPEGT